MNHATDSRPQRDLLRTVFARFDTRADFVAGEPWGTGHINDTYRVAADLGGHEAFFTLQRVNTRVFKDGPGLMDNILRVTRHAAARLRDEGAPDVSRRALQVIPARDGRPFHRDAEGSLWRMYVFVDGARTRDHVDDPRQAYEAARAFGRFQRLLADLPGGPLRETIPHFHNTRRRFEALRAAVSADARGRAASARAEIDFALAREAACDVILDLMVAGDIPVRSTHNDTKINNVLMDDATGEGLCVIDLDTCMPGCALYDFGDMMRAATVSTSEAEPDPARACCRLPVFEALARGYLEVADFLVPAERAHLVTGGKLMTFEIGVRFLTDYLQGDVYFKIRREGHNLARCRTQFALLKSIEDREPELRRIADGAAAGARAPAAPEGRSRAGRTGS
ncbi:MAG: aminoglycoside phosphotransferase family protein [Lentisphaerae bacterium]|nr:aminoglycoside phosphotransferase family protein [Lentisphaerota bacterium]